MRFGRITRLDWALAAAFVVVATLASVASRFCP